MEASSSALPVPDRSGLGGQRWELYRLLAEPVRLRLLALAAAEELAIGELAELLGESQPNVSRHLTHLRRSGLLRDRREGTRTFVRLADELEATDPVVADALAAGRALCAEDGSLGRVAEVVRARDEAVKAFFAEPPDGLPGSDPRALPDELPAYLTALAPLIESRRLAVDAGTGEGRLLDLVAPVFERVIAVDRSPAQLARARARVAARGYGHVELVEAAYDDAAVRARVQDAGGADVVFASRVLHHAPRPAAALGALAELPRPGGAVVVIDYAAHDDERLRERQADQWLGFAPAELAAWARRAGLRQAVVHRIPRSRCGGGPDAAIDWQVLVARRPRRAGKAGDDRRKPAKRKERSIP